MCVCVCVCVCVSVCVCVCVYTCDVGEFWGDYFKIVSVYPLPPSPVATLRSVLVVYVVCEFVVVNDLVCFHRRPVVDGVVV